jgi:glycosyltransferase involved in cell wall biosynthesis
MINKKKIAIFIDTHKRSGGVYQEILYNIKRIKKYNKENLKFVIILTSKNLDINLANVEYEIHHLPINPIDRYICFLRNYNPTIRRLKNKFFFRNKIEIFLKKNNVDIVFFPNASPFAQYLENTKYIINIPDVNHREDLEFPEFVDNAEFLRKDELFNNSLPKALAVITNSEITKKKISFFYNVPAERIIVINQSPSNAIDNFVEKDEKLQIEVRRKYNLPKKYIFYPAMYFPHKNHKNLIDSLLILKKEYKINLKIVFCGNDHGYLNNLKNYAKKINFIDDIRFLDFIDDHELPYLYLDSLCLVMPTLAGPTNIPPWEAFKMNVPVIYSDLQGMRNVYGESVLYIDPLNPISIAKNINDIYTNNELRNNLINHGRKIYKELENKHEFTKFFSIIKRYRKIKETWDF